ncbi:uncharacterized protein LOC110036534 [Phalaenopsis equestris]|uniref:uncharacterized protein LOC110036534 n=1 Tax=Phalaenopsis equestris TaxID=78828 RepID=UPI0009E48E9B|nr:uncharacterized protein LOC110036534 [Phalaenopsis equestris]
MPSEIKWIIKRIVRWSILPADCIPNSCIINIYNEGDYIPPHTDHHDLMRPVCTVSCMSKSNIQFGKDIDVIGSGEFRGSVEIPLLIGSILILKGNGLDLADRFNTDSKRKWTRPRQALHPMGMTPQSVCDFQKDGHQQDAIKILSRSRIHQQDAIKILSRSRIGGAMLVRAMRGLHLKVHVKGILVLEDGLVGQLDQELILQKTYK